MAKILNWISVQKKLKEKRLSVFRPWDIIQLFGVSKSAAAFFLHRNAKRGLLIRLKKSRENSLYAISDNLPSPYVITNILYEPSYISFDTALSFYGVIPETIYGITSATPKATREFIINSVAYTYLKIKKQAFTGYKPIKYQNTIILIAEPEKALADYLYFVELGKRGLYYERMNLKKINQRKLKNHVKLFQRPKMNDLVRKIYADFRKYKRAGK